MQDTATITLRRIECHKCAAVYALTERFAQQRQDEGGDWHCPYCQTCTAYTDPKSKKLERELAQERARHDQTKANRDYHAREAERIERRRRATLGAKTKLERRVKNGVCPCCTRSFANLQRHMTTEHPDYAVAETES